MIKEKINRKGFIKLLSLGALAGVGLGIKSKVAAGEQGHKGARQWGMVIDQDKCTGCGYCTLACQAHNDCPPDIEWNRVIDTGRYANKPVYISRPCMHCDHAPCVHVCPVKASYKRDDGIVMMNYDRCIGCRYCEVACPYGARAFNWVEFTEENPAVPKWGIPEISRRPRGVVEKCSFCYHRIDRALSLGLEPGVHPEGTPACVVACPVNARIFGDLNDPNSEVSRLLNENPYYRLRDDLGTECRVYYLSVRESLS